MDHLDKRKAPVQIEPVKRAQILLNIEKHRELIKKQLRLLDELEAIVK